MMSYPAACEVKRCADNKNCRTGTDLQFQSGNLLNFHALNADSVWALRLRWAMAPPRRRDGRNTENYRLVLVAFLGNGGNLLITLLL